MVYDEDLAKILRDALYGSAGITGKKMFGGLCLFNNGHMLCGVHSRGGDGGMFRVVSDHYESAFAIEGIVEPAFTGKPIKGMVEVSGRTLRRRTEADAGPRHDP